MRYTDMHLLLMTISSLGLRWIDGGTWPVCRSGHGGGACIISPTPFVFPTLLGMRRTLTLGGAGGAERLAERLLGVVRWQCQVCILCLRRTVRKVMI